MNKLDPFEGDEEGSDSEVAHAVSTTESVHLQQTQDQVY